MDDRQIREPDFNALVDFFAGQAHMALGAVNHPQTNAPVIDLPYAKHAIDLLTLIEQKTEGNLTAPEKNYLQNMLYQLRMTFIRIEQAAQQAAIDDAETTDESDSDE